MSRPSGRIRAPRSAEAQAGALALLRRAGRRAADGSGRAALEADLLQATARLADAEAMALVTELDGALSVSRLTLDARHADRRRELEAELRHVAGEAMRRASRAEADDSDRTASHATPSRVLPARVAVAAGLGDGRSTLAMVIRQGEDGAGAARGVLHLAAFALGALQADGAGADGALVRTLSALAASSPRSPVEAAEALRKALGARIVLVGDADGSILAMAPAGALDPNAPAARDAADLLRRAARGDGPIVEDAQGPLAAALSAASVCALKASPAGAKRRLGALVVAPEATLDLGSPHAWKVLERATETLGADVSGPSAGLASGLRRRAAPLLAATLLAAAMFLPWPDRIRAEAELEPLSRRFVAASFEAVLTELRVEAGDVVAAGDLLARLEGEELRLRRDAAAARRDEAMRRRDAALRDGRIAAAELARLDGEAAAAEADLLEWRLARLELSAPVAGVVLESAFEDAEGAPVRAGDVIAEVAPLERLQVRLWVPMEDLARLREADHAMLSLDGLAGDPLRLEDLRPAPRAEARDGAVALPLTAEIDNPDSLLRPGQRGVAVLPVGRARLGEVLFRRAWGALHRWLL